MAGSWWTASSFEAPIASTPAAANWLMHAGHDPEDHGIQANQRFRIVDESTGEPLAGIAYQMECDGQVIKLTRYFAILVI